MLPAPTVYYLINPPGQSLSDDDDSTSDGMTFANPMGPEDELDTTVDGSQPPLRAAGRRVRGGSGDGSDGGKAAVSMVRLAKLQRESKELRVIAQAQAAEIASLEAENRKLMDAGAVISVVPGEPADGDSGRAERVAVAQAAAAAAAKATADAVTEQEKTKEKEKNAWDTRVRLRNHSKLLRFPLQLGEPDH